MVYDYFRNVFIGQVDSKTGYVSRDLQDLRQTISGGGVPSVDSRLPPALRRRGGAVFRVGHRGGQSAEKAGLPASARPTLETMVAKGVVQTIDLRNNTFDLVGSHNNKVETFRIRKDEKAALFAEGLHEGMKTAVVYSTGGG